MNRIQLLDEDSSKTRGKLAPRHPQRTTPASGDSGCDPCFFVPLHYEPNYAYPLVVWLHGPGDDQRQLNQVMPHISVRNYVGVAVASPLISSGRQWPQDVRGICDAFETVEAAVAEAAERFHLAEHRIFLAGYDCGGSMALRLGLAAPGRFAGAASLGGPVPQDLHPLSNLKEARRLPMMIAHGRDSEVYPVQRVCDELRLFHSAGMSLNLRQYPCQQELTTQMLSDLNVWMMQIVTGVETPGSYDASRRRSMMDN